MKPERNDPCPCDSGKKYKKCCHGKPGFNPSAPDSIKTGAPTLAECNQLVALFNAGNHVELESRTRILIEQYPEDGFAWKVLGVALQAQGKNALPAMEKAMKLLPDDAEAHNNLGIALTGLGQLDDAVASYRRALEINPDYAEAHSNLGVALKDLGQLDDAVASYRRALAIKPDYAAAHSNLGEALRGLGQLNEAVASYRRALEINPDYAEAHSNLGVALKDLGQLNDAVASYRRALEIKPNFAEAHSNLGEALRDLGQLNDAVASYRRALEIKPNFAEAHSNLGNALKDIGQLNDAVAHSRRALEIKPDCAEAYSNLGNVLTDLGQLDNAVASYRRALEINPDYAEAHSNLLFMFAYSCYVTPLEYLEEARKWETRIIPQTIGGSSNICTFDVLQRAGRRLKIGYVSGDFRQHPVSNFVEQLFMLHDRSRVELFLYPTSTIRDKVSRRLEALADQWTPLTGLSDDAACSRIKADEIDVLIDLSGHTAHSGLKIFALRSAPVQAHYLGYFASTGVSEMDYWIGDSVLLPESENDHFGETLWRLPRVWVSYQGSDEAPVSRWCPAKDGTVWLGSFNNLNKIFPETVALWAKVLHALPEGRLLLKTRGLENMANRERIQASFGAYGISGDRLELIGSTADWLSHMALYDRLDIALDPAGGVGGGTTTCDALWMGVPVITLAGQTMAQRMTASMLDAIGHPEWIAVSEADYVTKVISTVSNVEERARLRFFQREKMRNSPLCDAEGLARSLEDAYEAMFDMWWQTKSSTLNANNASNQLC